MRNCKRKNKPTARSKCKEKTISTKRKKCRRKRKITSYRGYYQGIKCDSRWELAFLIYCLDKGRKIKRCDKVFYYTVKGKEHKYFPDFMINNIIIEIKGKWKKNLQHKLMSVINEGYKIKLIDQKNIGPYLKYCYKKFGTEELQKLYD